MRTGLLSFAISAAVALLLSLLTFLAARQAQTEEVRSMRRPCICPQAPGASTRPKFAERSHDLDLADEVAALEAVSVALTQVGDGSSYVWHRGNGRLSGLIQPTASFKDTAGRVCRHVVVMLSTETRSSRMEGVACRMPDGRWQLEG